MSFNFNLTLLNEERGRVVIPEMIILSEEKGFIPFEDVKKEISEIAYEKIREANNLTQLDKSDYDLRTTRIIFNYNGPTVEHILNQEGSQTLSDLQSREFFYDDGIFINKHIAEEQLETINVLADYVLYR